MMVLLPLSSFSLLGPLLRLHIINVGVVVLVAVRINFVILTQESALIECVLVGEIARFRYLVLGSVEDIRGVA